MSGGGKISATKLSFTLPISCQICLEKVKEPVTCPNHHVFCSLCMEVWLERNKQCPTCRVDITPQSPIRKIIGGDAQAQSSEIRSPRTSKHMRRARMELLFRDYENEISELQREVACLEHSNEDLKTRLHESEQKNLSGHTVTKTKCSRCGNMKDLDSMLEMAKNLQEATRTFEKMKEENIQLKKLNEKLVKEVDDLKRQNTSVKEELLMRSPMKFGRLTVATLQSRIDAYEKKISQLNKALEKSDSYTESLQEKLKSCICTTDYKLEDEVLLKNIVNEQETDIANQNVVYLSEHDYTCINIPDNENSVSKTVGTDVSDGAMAYTIENILTEDLVSQSLASAAIDENSVDSSLLITQTGDSKSPFTPSTKFSEMSLATPTTLSTSSCLTLNVGEAVPFHSYAAPNSVATQQTYQSLPTIKEHDARVRSFTAQMMPPVESPDYKEKLEQIQGNLLHPITSSGSPAPGNVRSFSRRLTFEETLQAAKTSETFDLKYLEENTRSSCGDEVMMMLQSEDSIQSIETEQDVSKIHDESRFVRPRSIFKCDVPLLETPNELNEGSSNPVLSSGQYQTEEGQFQNQTPKLRREASSSVIEAGSSRITTMKLSQGDRDAFTRPSSAPSRTFLLSGSRFSALRPIDTSGQDATELSQFQPVKCKSPSPLSMRKLQPSPQNRGQVTSKKEGIRCVVDGRVASPMLRLVSPDEVISTNWKQTACHARSSSSSDETTHAQANYKSKEAISRIAILKRNNSGTALSSYQSNTEVARSSFNPVHLQHTEENVASTSRRSSRKQCLNDPNSKRVGEHSLEFVSPIKSPKIEAKWSWSSTG